VVSSVERHHRRFIGGRSTFGFLARAREIAVAIFSDDGGGGGLGLRAAQRTSVAAAVFFIAGFEKRSRLSSRRLRRGGDSELGCSRGAGALQRAPLPDCPIGLPRRSRGVPLGGSQGKRAGLRLGGRPRGCFGGDDEAAEVVEKGPELQVVGCCGNGAVEGKIFIDSAFAALDSGIDPGDRPCQPRAAEPMWRATLRAQPPPPRHFGATP
jgi:hypothetical protein